MIAAGSGAKKDPAMGAIAEVIERLNEQFGDEEFTQGQKESIVQTALNVMLENDTLRTQAAANTAQQFAESPDLQPELLASVADGSDGVQKIADYFFDDNPSVDALIRSLAGAYHVAVQQQVGAGTAAS